MANALLMRALAWSSIAASATAANYAADNLSPHPKLRMGRVWRSPAGEDTRSLQIDMGVDVAINTIALFGIGNADGAPNGSWSWKIDLATEAQGVFSGAFWSGGVEDLLAGSVLPVSGRGKALWLAPSDAPTSARYIRISFSALASAALQVAIVAVGERFQPSRNYDYGAAFGVRDMGSLSHSARGAVAKRRGAKLRGMGLSFRSVYKDELEEGLQRDFELVGNTEPVVVVSDPAPHAQRQNRMGIGHLTGNLGSVHRVPNHFQADVNLVAVD